ncbi:FKBP-type peptidyl-prolyl cis-trans isomerase [Candidatus Anstonella stagnisolia]|nr:FKBP-type peptidyl-prolyl cis-trans isomerase [Candidatus Anstonella stagnisolia]
MKAMFAIALAIILLFGCTNTNTSGENMKGKTNTTTNEKNISTGSNGKTGTSGTSLFVKRGDTVSVDYIGTLPNGTLFDTSIQAEAAKGGLALRDSYEPLTFTVGAGQMIAGFDAGVIGMKINETKTITLTPAQAYGEKDKTRVIAVPLANIQSDGRNVTIGGFVYTPSGARGIISGINGTDALIDFNHPLAGETLIFKITVKEIKSS